MKKAFISAVLAAVTLVGIGSAATAHADGTTPPSWDFYGVPQLGHEPVRGSGCGGDGSIGDVIPDGYWRGYMTSLDYTTGIQFDLVCIYLSPQPSSLAQVPDGWLTNNNARTRFVPIAPTFYLHGTRFQPDGSVPFTQTATVDQGGTYNGDNIPFDGGDAWLYIANGQAQWVIGAPATGAPVPAPAPPPVIAPGVIEDGVHFGYAVNTTPTSISFDRADVAADGSWTNNNPKVRTLPVNPDFWASNLYPSPGQPIEIHVQGQQVTLVMAATAYPSYNAGEYVEDDHCGC